MTWTPAKLAAWHVQRAERDPKLSWLLARPVRNPAWRDYLSAALSIIRWQGRPHQRAEAIRLLNVLEGK